MTTLLTVYAETAAVVYSANASYNAFFLKSTLFQSQATSAFARRYDHLNLPSTASAAAVATEGVRHRQVGRRLYLEETFNCRRWWLLVTLTETECHQDQGGILDLMNSLPSTF